MASSDEELPKFHDRVGSLVQLSNDNRTAQRNHPAQEFNNGVVIGCDPLKEDQLFEVRIDKKVNSWSGSIEIGITTCDPNNLKFPISATGLREGTWVMSGSSILKDGHSVTEEYGADLDQLAEGDTVGVMVSWRRELRFFVNGIDQGVAATTEIASTVYAVVDMYGKCSQVSIIKPGSVNRTDNNITSNDVASQSANEFLTQLSNQMVNDLTRSVDALAVSNTEASPSNDILTFHQKCGSLIKLTNEMRTAERKHPLDEYNNGVVMTNRPLKDDEMFEIRLDMLVDKWSGSIEVGITTHNPGTLDIPATMTDMRSGTIMMSGCVILTNGKSTRNEYGQYYLDELAEGDRIGLMRKSNGQLHYYINGQDQGVASNDTPQTIWGVVDLYGMAVKATILDRTDPNYPNNIQNTVTRSNVFRHFPDLYDEEALEVTNVDITSNDVASQSANEFLTQLSNQMVNDLTRSVDALAVSNTEASPSNDILTFHQKCGSLIKLTNEMRTAERKHPLDGYNNGVVMTNRPLKDDEMFEIRLDMLVDKWTGSIEVGITTHNPGTLDIPATMTDMRSGTIMMSGCDILTNGKSTRNEYGQYNLDELAEGDRIGLMRKSNGQLHYYINGQDQGVASNDTPQTIWGVVDLYGMAVKATILDRTDPNYPNNIQNTVTRSNVFRHFPDLYDEEALEVTNVDITSNDVASQSANEFLTQLSNQMVNDLTRSVDALAVSNTEASPSNDILTFHQKCGSLIKLTNEMRTAERKHPLDGYNNGVVMTNRPLKDDEMFEIRLDMLVDKWSGSIEVGITTHNPGTLDIPATMTDMRSGTIMMSGCDILTNGKSTRNEYGQYNLDELAEGYRIGLMRKSNGQLHYYINGQDQGVASNDTPQTIWGVVDLYGMAVKATILDRTDPNYPNNIQNTVTRSNVFRHFPDLYDEEALEVTNVDITSNDVASQSANEFLTQLSNQIVNDLTRSVDALAVSNTEASPSNDILTFHQKCGSLIKLTNEMRTAERKHPLDEFNNGVVMTNRPLKDDEMFETPTPEKEVDRDRTRKRKERKRDMDDDSSHEEPKKRKSLEPSSSRSSHNKVNGDTEKQVKRRDSESSRSEIHVVKKEANDSSDESPSRLKFKSECQVVKVKKEPHEPTDDSPARSKARSSQERQQQRQVIKLKRKDNQQMNLLLE